MIRPLMMFAVAGIALGCGTSAPTGKPARQVGWTALVDEYRADPAAADRNYRNNAIQVYLPAKSYRVEPGRISAYFGLPGTPGALVFDCTPPETNSAPLLVSGLCRGRTNDGVERANKTLFYVRVEYCTVTVLGR